MLKVTAVLLSALVLGACTQDTTAPTQPHAVSMSASLNQSANSNRTSGIACVINPSTCATEFASWTLDINWNDEFNRYIAENGSHPPYSAWFTNDYHGANDGHFKIKVIWETDGFFHIIDSQGRLNGVNLKNMIAGPPGLGQAGK